MSDLVGNPEDRFSRVEAQILFSNRPKRKNGGSNISMTKSLDIRKTCSCKVYPLEPHIYIAKLGYAGVYLFFLFLIQNIDCGNVYPRSMF